MPDQFLNKEAMGDNDLQKKLDEVRQMMAKGDIDRAMAELEKLSQSLDKMMSSMEQDLKGFRQERFGPEEKAMAEVENKLADLAEEERRLRDETTEVQKRARAEAQRQMKDKIEALQKRTREKVQRLKKQLGALDPMALSGYDQEELGRIKKRVEDTDRALGEGDVDEARGMARQAHEGLRQMAMDLRDEEMRGWTRTPPKLKQSREQVSNDEMLAREIAEELDKAMPKPSQLMSPDDQKRLSELGKRQEALRKRAQEMAKELGKPRVGPDGKPMQLPIPKELSPGLREAGQHMERAEDDLRGQAPREAVGEEGQALEKLNQMKEQMQRERRPKDQQAGGRMDKEPVRIPGADEFRAPKEFRQDLLDAMKRGAPAEYKEQLKRYYEELAK
jgi:HAMP domain-containing protein